MGAVTTPHFAQVRFADDDVQFPQADISMFNISPMSPCYSASPLLKHRRTQKLLLKRKKLQQLKVQQDDEQPLGRFSRPFPNNGIIPTFSRTRNGITEDGAKSRDDFTDKRRQDFMKRRRSLIQNQIRNQLSLPLSGFTRRVKHSRGYPHSSVKVITPDSDNDDNVTPIVDVTSCQNAELLDMPKPARLSQRRQSLIRTSSFAVRSANTITRKAVRIISGAIEGKKQKKRKTQSAKEIQEHGKELARKYSMMWMSKTVESKRMGLMRDPAMEEDSTPFNKFRRAARLVKSLIQVCRVCQELVMDSVSSEDWYKKIESFIDSTEMISKAQGPSKVRPFITFVQDTKSKELVQLQFDKSMFARERRADYLLTSEIRNFLQIPSFERTVDQENEVLMFMKRAVPQFNGYSLDSQRRIVQCMHYDKYERDRVITRQGLTADGVYFVLSGTLIEKDGDKKNLREMKPGESFGEEDIICGCPRRNTVVTRSEVELVSIHRLDYRAIVHMADDSSHPKYLDICRHDIVFQHFPMRKLMENPGVWTLLSYKYGRLIVKDSNEMEWIYIIKSGEAKVLKQLTVGKIDLRERRRNILAKRNQTDPHAFKRKMITFVSEREYLKSQYKTGEYMTGISRSASLRSIHSAPSTARDTTRDRIGIQPHPASAYIKPITQRSKSEFFTLRKNSKHINQMPKILTKMDSRREMKQNGELLKVEFDTAIEQDDTELETDDLETPLTTASSNEGHGIKKRVSQIRIVDDKDDKDVDQLKTHASYIDTSSKSNVKLPSLHTSASKSSLFTEDKKARMINVPEFVQLESLHAGKVFGLRSCLPPEDRGPSASLVSSGCEVLQVNKKFFMKHADEALLGLIRVQYKPFATEDDLIDRLDNNFQWEEYKQSTVGDFLVRKGKMKEEELRNVTIELSRS